MASVKFQKGTEEWLMFQEYYGLVQKYYKPEDADTYWDELTKETNRFCEKYREIPLAKKIGLALTETLDEEYRKLHDNKIISKRG